MKNNNHIRDREDIRQERCIHHENMYCLFIWCKNHRVFEHVLEGINEKEN